MYSFYLDCTGETIPLWQQQPHTQLFFILPETSRATWQGRNKKMRLNCTNTQDGGYTVTENALHNNSGVHMPNTRKMVKVYHFPPPISKQFWKARQ
jgi:hypothetical protein